MSLPPTTNSRFVVTFDGPGYDIRSEYPYKPFPFPSPEGDHVDYFDEALNKALTYARWLLEEGDKENVRLFRETVVVYDTEFILTFKLKPPQEEIEE
jgi:hypothetical protein